MAFQLGVVWWSTLRRGLCTIGRTLARSFHALPRLDFHTCLADNRSKQVLGIHLVVASELQVELVCLLGVADFCKQARGRSSSSVPGYPIVDFQLYSRIGIAIIGTFQSLQLLLEVFSKILWAHFDDDQYLVTFLHALPSHALEVVPVGLPRRDRSFNFPEFGHNSRVIDDLAELVDVLRPP